MDYKMLIDMAWTFLGAVLVMFMQPGFAMVETGFTRAKNAGNIMMKNTVDFMIGSIMFLFIGFALMFGGTNPIVGTSGFFDPTSLHLEQFDALTPELFIFFQTVFCATAATIVSGAIAGRTNFLAYCLISAFVSLVIYPISGHWIWGGGFLQTMGFVDFAGSTAVHSVGGWVALVSAILIGPRIGKYSKSGKSNAIPGHSLTLGALGVFILWFAWFGFNCGSTLAVNDEIGHIAMTTNLAAAAGGLATMIFTWIRYGKPDVSMTLNGVLAGLVGVTAGCEVVTLVGSIIIGILCGILVALLVPFIDQKLKIDDPVGAISVHCGCGVFGTFLVGLFADYQAGTDGAIVGLLYGGGFHLLLVQILGIICVGAWACLTSYVFLVLLKTVVPLRASREFEINGLDISEHGCDAYADFVERI